MENTDYKSAAFLLYLTITLFIDPTLGHTSNSNKRQNLTLSIENDSLSIENQDKDYTFAVDANYALLHKPNTQNTFMRLSKKLHHVFFDQIATIKASSFSAGIFGFTAKIKSIPNTYHQERPYASIVYLSATNFLLNTHQNQGFKYAINIGLLGLDTFRHLQNAYHKQVGFNSLNGWEKQISPGGEPTAKVSIEWQQPIIKNNGFFMISHTVKGSVGYITELQHAIYLRLGKLSSPWWYQQLTTHDYGEKPLNFARRHSETFFSLGLFNKARLYNAFLQGQLTKSEQTLGLSESKSHLYGLWMGVEQHFAAGFSVSYLVNYQSSEIKQGRANRAMRWGRLSFSQSF